MKTLRNVSLENDSFLLWNDDINIWVSYVKTSYIIILLTLFKN